MEELEYRALDKKYGVYGFEVLECIVQELSQSSDLSDILRMLNLAPHRNLEVQHATLKTFLGANPPGKLLDAVEQLKHERETAQVNSSSASDCRLEEVVSGLQHHLQNGSSYDGYDGVCYGEMAPAGYGEVTLTEAVTVSVPEPEPAVEASVVVVQEPAAEEAVTPKEDAPRQMEHRGPDRRSSVGRRVKVCIDYPNDRRRYDRRAEKRRNS